MTSCCHSRHCVIEVHLGVADLPGESKRWVGTDEIQRRLPVTAFMKGEAFALGCYFGSGLVLGGCAPAIAGNTRGIHTCPIASECGQDRLWRASKRNCRQMTTRAAELHPYAAPGNLVMGYAGRLVLYPHPRIGADPNVEAVERKLKASPRMSDGHIVRNWRRNARLKVAAISAPIAAARHPRVHARAETALLRSKARTGRTRRLCSSRPCRRAHPARERSPRRARPHRFAPARSRGQSAARRRRGSRRLMPGRQMRELGARCRAPPPGSGRRAFFAASLPPRNQHIFD